MVDMFFVVFASHRSASDSRHYVHIKSKYWDKEIEVHHLFRDCVSLCKKTSDSQLSGKCIFMLITGLFLNLFVSFGFSYSM